MGRLSGTGVISKFVSGGALGLVRLFAGFIRIKYLALMLGTAGVGLVAQANQFYILCISLMTVSMSLAIINRSRHPARQSSAELRAQTQGTGLISVLFLIVIITSLLATFQALIVKNIFSDHIEAAWLIPLFIGLPFSSIASGYFEGLFFSRDRYDLYIRASALSVLFELFWYALFISLYGLKGALIGLGLSGPMLFLSFSFYLRKLGEPLSSLISFDFDFGELKEMLRYCFAMVGSVALGYVATLWIRADIIGSLSPSENGILQPAISLSAYTLPLVTNGIWGHLHPFASASGDNKEGRKELDTVLKVVICLSAMSAMTLITFSHLLIQFAFTKAFLPSQNLFPYQMTGDFFYHIFFAANAYLLCTSQLKSYVLGWFFYYCSLYLAVQWLLPKVGIISYSFGHLGASGILFSASLIWFYKEKIITSVTTTLLIVSMLSIFAVAGGKLLELHTAVQVGLWLVLTANIFFMFKKLNQKEAL